MIGSYHTFAFMVKEIPYKRLVIAAYRLPFSFIKTKKSYRVVQNSGGLVSAMLSLSEKFKESNDKSMKDQIIWTGTADNSADIIFKQKFENDSFSIVPVKIPKHLNDLYYNGFCNDMLWPLFHYFPTYSVFNDSYFHAYHEANSIFCSEIVKIIRPGDFIWIHDYQLFLLPAMIRKKVPDVTLGLRDDLSEIIRHKTDFEILEGNKVLEVKSGKYDKGEMAKSIMKNKNFDFVLAAGDDKTDESIYRALDEKAYTIRVGLNPSEAKFNITDYSLLLRLLQDLKN